MYKLNCVVSLLMSCSLVFALPSGSAPVHKAMPAEEQAELNYQKYKINNMIAAQKNQEKNSVKDIDWAVNIVMLAGGIILVETGKEIAVGAALIVGSTLSMIMMSPMGSQINSAVVSHLIQTGMPAEEAQIAATVMINTGIIAISMSASSVEQEMMMNSATEEQAFSQVYSQEMSSMQQGVSQTQDISNQLRQESSSIMQDMSSMVQSTKI